MGYDPNTESVKEPFRFQTLQQKRLYGKLRLLGPGPATFYREACILLTPPQQFESTTHLVAHLLREIESAVRQVLLPYDYSPPEPCPTCRNQSEAHAKQIDAIAQSLGLDENLREKWKEIATRNRAFNGLAALAHREDLSLPRVIDSSFLTLVNIFEVVFDSVLTAFERQSIDVFALLDSLLLKELPSKKDLKTFKNKVPHNDATHRYFFERLQFPGWLEPLHREGFFRQVSPREWDEESGRPVFSPWSCSPYLLRMAAIEPAQQTILVIISEVARTDNPFVRYDILQLAQVLPASLATNLVPAIQRWIQDQLVQTVDLTQITKFITHLAQGSESDSSLTLLETCLITFAHKESLSDRWYYEKLLATGVPLLVKGSAVAVLSMLCRLLETEVYDHYIRYREVQEDQTERLQKEAQESSTASWQPTIGISPNETLITMYNPLNALVAVIYKAAEQAVREHLLSVVAVVSLFESYPGRIFRRLALYILSRFPQETPELVKRYLLNQMLFDDADVRHEYGLLARAGLSLLSPSEQEEMLRWIKAGPDLQNYRNWYDQIYHVMPSDELVQGYANTWRRDWFGRIGDGLPNAWKARYDVLVTEYGPYEPEDTGFHYGTWVGPTSALTIEELRRMSIDQLLSYLRTWQPSEDFMRPSREGLGRLLTVIVGEDPERFAKHARQFQGYDPIYVSTIVQGFTDAIRNHRPFDWERVLDLCKWIINRRYSLSSGGTATTYDSDWAWTCQMIAHLLLSATEAQPSVLPVSLRTKIWDILEPLADDPDLAQNDEADNDYGSEEDYVNKYATRAINSIRGTALHAVVSFAWWLHHQLEQGEGRNRSQGLSRMSEVQTVLERHLDPDRDASLTVRSVFGQRLPFLVALDAQWTAEHLSHLFPHTAHQQALRNATWNTYIVYCNPYNQVFRLLQEEYAEAIERLDVPKQRKSIVDDPDYHLGEHLIKLYWSDQISLASPESLLTRFFAKAPDSLRGQVLAFIGRAFYDTGENTPAEIIERSQQLWEWRLSEAQTAASRTEYMHELAAFGWWFRANICPPEWGMQQLESVFMLLGSIDMSYEVVERLAGLVEQYPAQVVRFLDFLVKGDTMMWTTSTWEKAVRPILINALQQRVEETQQRAKAVISYLAVHGMTNFLELLPKE